MTTARRCCRCGTSLARDNASLLCGVCQQQPRRDRAPEVPPDFWHTDAMLDALASGDLGRVIRAYRSHPWHVEPLSQTVVAGWLHVSQTSLSRIEQGKCRLTVDDITWFAGALGLNVALRWVPQFQAGEDVNPLSRRSLLGAGVGAGFGLNATTAPTAAREVDPALVGHWMTLLRILGCHDAMFGPRDVLDTVRREVGMVANQRQVARGALRTQLLSVESRWAWLASWLANDSGDWYRRDAWADQALQLAQEAGDADMATWSLVWQSRWAAMSGDARGAIAFAVAAQRTPGAAPKIRGLGALKEAHGHALAGDVSACERSLADAYGRLDGGDPVTLSAELGRRDDSAAPYVPADAARCWLLLRPQKAVAMIDDALRAWPQDRTRGLGVQQARLALACASNDVDRAAAEGMRALDIARTTKSDMMMRELAQLDRALAPCDLPAAADFREAFATL